MTLDWSYLGLLDFSDINCYLKKSRLIIFCLVGVCDIEKKKTILAQTIYIAHPYCLVLKNVITFI